MDTYSPQPDPAKTTAKPGFRMHASRNFKSWLVETRVSLAVSTYQKGALFLVGLKPDGNLSLSTHRFSRCMGVYADRDKIWTASLHQLWRFANHAGDLAPGEGVDRVYRPRVAYVTGDLDIHEMAEDAEGRLIFVNTLFSCLATPSMERSFTPLWQPTFISRLAAEDRCHLNGLAMRGGQPFIVSAVADTDVVQGWREHRVKGGILIDVATNEIVARGLTMPHSPRWAHGRLYVLNSGEGSFGTVDLSTGIFTEIAFCPGYARGMAIVGRYAVIGLSRAREGGSFGDLPLSARLARHRIEPRCGLMIVDLETGSAVEWLTFGGEVDELFDVAAIPNTRHPAIMGDPRRVARQLVDI